jgi:hypothetical protein
MTVARSLFITGLKGFPEAIAKNTLYDLLKQQELKCVKIYQYHRYYLFIILED